MAETKTLESLDGLFFDSEHIIKMFPVSFERTGTYDRVISEENLVDWFRGVAADSADTKKNSRYSYVMTDTVSSNFGKTDTVHYLEFILGGYYVKITDQGFKSFVGSSDIYAVIDEVSTTDFRHLAYGDSITNGKFSAMRIVYIAPGEELDISGSMYKLHILTKTESGFTIPAESKRSTYAVDGGVIE